MMAGILVTLKEAGMSLVAALLTKAFLRGVILKVLRGEAEAYAARAKLTEKDPEDDARAKMFLGVVDSLEKAWKA